MTFQPPIFYHGNHILDKLINWLNLQPKSRRYFVVVDDVVFDLHFNKLLILLQYDFVFIPIVICNGEAHKSLTTVEKICKQLLEHNASRGDCLLAFGGGVVCDITGFCASIFKRGISFISIPTTLMAMTDAAIGGKNAVDFNCMKNILGTFKNPDLIVADLEFLKTLPAAEWLNGWAEIFKHALIADAKLWNMIPSEFNQQILNDEILCRSIDVKMEVVQQDFFDLNKRKILNHGHTIAHVLESFALKHNDSSFSHGNALVWGMLVENCIARRLDLLSSKVEKIIADKILSFFNPTKFLYPITHDLQMWIVNDKKNDNNSIKMALLKDIGHSIVDVEVPYHVVLDAFNELKFVVAND